MLNIDQLECGYGKKQVLFGLSLEVGEGEIVALIGPNGAGKSTVLKTVFGLVRTWTGKIEFDGISINSSTPAENVSTGILYAPQGNRVFTDMTVMENLELGGYFLPKKAALSRIAEMLDLFPALRVLLNKDAGNLSGGEQQMLALARVLIPKPKLLLFDEPSLGLAPKLVNMILNKIHEISRQHSLSVLIVEQKVHDVLQLCDRVYSMKLGKVAFQGAPSDLLNDQDKLRNLFL